MSGWFGNKTWGVESYEKVRELSTSVGQVVGWEIASRLQHRPEMKRPMEERVDDAIDVGKYTRVGIEARLPTLNVVVGDRPMLYMFSPCSAAELCKRAGLIG